MLKIDGFLTEFVTPIVKVSFCLAENTITVIKVSKGREEMSFFTVPEFESWKKSQDGAKGWKIKYYKG